jgi:hypothetical protein
MPFFIPSIIFKGWTYDIVMLLVLIGTVWRLRSEVADRADVLIFGLGIGAIAHQVAFFIVSPTSAFRYLLPTVLTCLLQLLMIATRIRASSNGCVRAPVLKP